MTPEHALLELAKREIETLRSDQRILWRTIWVMSALLGFLIGRVLAGL